MVTTHTIQVAVVYNIRLKLNDWQWQNLTKDIQIFFHMIRLCSHIPLHLLCFPKQWFKAEKVHNLDIICNVRSDTAFYELPPEKTGKKGRPRVRGKRLSLKDIHHKGSPGSEYLAGCQRIKIMLFRKREVWAIVTKSEKGNQRRLFLCTKDPKAALFANANADFFSLSLRPRKTWKLIFSILLIL